MKNITLAQAFPIIQETLAAGGNIRYYPKGISMLPMLRQGKDSVILQKQMGRLHVGDIPLFQRNDGRFVLHRIIKVRKADYILCGDNQNCPETGITDQQIIGVVQGFYRDETLITENDLDYRQYVKKTIKQKKRAYYKNLIRILIMHGKHILYGKA